MQNEAFPYLLTDGRTEDRTPRADPALAQEILSPWAGCAPPHSNDIPPEHTNQGVGFLPVPIIPVHCTGQVVQLRGYIVYLPPRGRELTGMIVQDDIPV